MFHVLHGSANRALVVHHLPPSARTRDYAPEDFRYLKFLDRDSSREGIHLQTGSMSPPAPSHGLRPGALLVSGAINLVGALLVILAMPGAASDSRMASAWALVQFLSGVWAGVLGANSPFLHGLVAGVAGAGAGARAAESVARAVRGGHVGAGAGGGAARRGAHALHAATRLNGDIPRFPSKGDAPQEGASPLLARAATDDGMRECRPFLSASPAAPASRRRTSPGSPRAPPR